MSYLLAFVPVKRLVVFSSLVWAEGVGGGGGVGAQGASQQVRVECGSSALCVSLYVQCCFLPLKAVFFIGSDGLSDSTWYMSPPMLRSTCLSECV